MPGSLTPYLQAQFSNLCPRGFKPTIEATVLGGELAEILGYSPRADIRLDHSTTGRRYWVEFEISRADPVANHAKFATGHIMSPLPDEDIFVSMVSSHVDIGLRSLACHAVKLLRLVGVDAHQVTLFPQLDGEEVKRLNHKPLPWLMEHGPDVGGELDRVLSLSKPAFEVPGHRIDFTYDRSEVSANIIQWNREIKGKAGPGLWGRRRVTYFVYDPGTRLFAPSKFAAYLPRLRKPRAGHWEDWGMTLSLYCMLDEGDKRFDGHIARLHLQKHLGYRLAHGDEKSKIGFENWAKGMGDALILPEGGGEVLVLRASTWGWPEWCLQRKDVKTSRPLSHPHEGRIRFRDFFE